MSETRYSPIVAKPYSGCFSFFWYAMQKVQFKRQGKICILRVFGVRRVDFFALGNLNRC